MIINSIWSILIQILFCGSGGTLIHVILESPQQYVTKICVRDPTDIEAIEATFSDGTSMKSYESVPAAITNCFEVNPGECFTEWGTTKNSASAPITGLQLATSDGSVSPSFGSGNPPSRTSDDGRCLIKIESYSSDKIYVLDFISGGNSECEDDAQCMDGIDPCNDGIEICNTDTGECESLGPIECINDGNPCNGIETCNTDTGECELIDPIECINDGNPCNGIETCNSVTGVCELLDPIICIDDGNPCNGQETCNTDTGECVSGPNAAGPNILCNDGNACTNDICDGGSCINPMTTLALSCESCDTQTGKCIDVDNNPQSSSSTDSSDHYSSSEEQYLDAHFENRKVDTNKNVDYLVLLHFDNGTLWNLFTMLIVFCLSNVALCIVLRNDK